MFVKIFYLKLLIFYVNFYVNLKCLSNLTTGHFGRQWKLMDSESHRSKHQQDTYHTTIIKQEKEKVVIY